MTAHSLTPNMVQRALESWLRGEALPANIRDLRLVHDAGTTPFEQSLELHRLFRSLVEEHLQIQRQIADLPAPSSDPLASLQADFQAAGRTNNKTLRAWSALYYRYLLDTPPDVQTLAHQAGYSPKHFRRYVQSGLRLLTYALHDVEQGVYQGAAQPPLTRWLPPAEYQHLFGAAPLVEEIVSLLQDLHAPPCISLEGIGGIGKTALARETTRHIVQQDAITDVLWLSGDSAHFALEGAIEPQPDAVRTQPEILARLAAQLGIGHSAGRSLDALRQRITRMLSSGRYLVVLDAIPGMRDLLPRLIQASDSTRWLLTSRQTLAPMPGVQVIRVPELTYDASAALLHYDLHTGGRAQPLPDDAMSAIFDTVGGLPLALKFVAHHLRSQSLPRVLRDFRMGQTPGVAALYQHIYHPAWDQLTPDAQALILMLAALPEQGASQIPDPAFGQALAQVIDAGLLEVSGPLHTPVYRCHTLTRTFAAMQPDPPIPTPRRI